MNAGAVLAAKQNRIIRLFTEGGVTTFASAATLEALGVRSSLVLRGLVRRGVLVKTDDGRYYLDEAAAAAFVRRRRVILLSMLVLIAVAIALVVLATSPDR